VCEPKERKRLRLAEAPLVPISLSVAPELDQLRLVRLQLQAKPRQPIAQLAEELLRLVPVLEPHDEVVREAHNHHIALRSLVPPSLNPQVDRVIEIAVGQQGAK
jgi:hypothetical protein